MDTKSERKFLEKFLKEQKKWGIRECGIKEWGTSTLRTL